MAQEYVPWLGIEHEVSLYSGTLTLTGATDLTDTEFSLGLNQPPEVKTTILPLTVSTTLSRKHVLVCVVLL